MTPLWIFDLDNTLYPAETGLFRRVDGRIQEFMTSRVGLDPAEVPRLRDEYRRDYGLTLGGLVAHHGVDPDEYLAFVHDVPLERYLSASPALGEALAALPGRRVVFTNGSEAHGRNVLGVLGIESLMEAVFDIAFMDYEPKPKPHGYRKLLATLGADPSQCWMVDDLPANLDTALSLGMATTLVGPEPRPPHRHVLSVKDLPRLVLS